MVKYKRKLLNGTLGIVLFLHHSLKLLAGWATGLLPGFVGACPRVTADRTGPPGISPLRTWASLTLLITYLRRHLWSPSFFQNIALLLSTEFVFTTLVKDRWLSTISPLSILFDCVHHSTQVSVNWPSVYLKTLTSVSIAFTVQSPHKWLADWFNGLWTNNSATELWEKELKFIQQ
jgi:hypothetical protein